jgi:peptidase M28-like protein/PDZ domain-containing protein
MSNQLSIRHLALLLPFAAACHVGRSGHSASVNADSTLVMRDVRHLASDSLEGRGTGTPGNDSAAAYIARRFAALRLEPAIPADSSCASSRRGACAPSYFQYFPARPAAHAGTGSSLSTSNVAAWLRGTDPALRDEYVVLGAHFDHLGRSTMGALDPDARDAIRNGADDNASGTAAVLELARLLAARPPRRSILFVTFSGEELGLLGSQYFVQHLPVPLERVTAMLNFDMVGRLRDNKLIVYGVATAAELPEILAAANVPPALRLTAIGDGFGPSDHSSFYAKDLPVLHFFTDLHEDYHRASDDAERVNGAGAARVIDYAARVVRAIADRPTRLTFTRARMPAISAGSREGSDVYLGSIPDMSAGEIKGLRLTGVRSGSPADVAGLRAGDVIVEFDGQPVGDLYEYSDALYAKHPGDTVRIVVLRDGSRVTLTATLGRRGA